VDFGEQGFSSFYTRALHLTRCKIDEMQRHAVVNANDT